MIASINYVLNKENLFEALIKFKNIFHLCFKQRNPKSYFPKTFFLITCLRFLFYFILQIQLKFQILQDLGNLLI
jgi:hypothetical protein